MGDLETRLQAVLGAGYRIERELGGGGMSRVFVVEELALGRRVVVKVLPPELAAGLNVERFRREVALAAALQHPHIVPLHTAGEGNGLFYYTMPLVEGESLRTMLARHGELPIGDVVRLLRDVVDSLSYAHKHGVVHRDIKPDNILITSNHAVVTDFGVAKALSEASGIVTMTQEGMALGTPAYMAPEQAAADPHVDHRADLYAVGAMAYEMLTGRPPFTGSSAQAVLVAHVTTAPQPVTQMRATVPPALEALVLRCLEKKPADRWQSAEEIVAQLEAMATPSGGIAPTRATAAVAAPAPRSRWRIPAFAAAIVLLGLGAWFAISRLTGRGAGGSGPPRLAVLPMENLGATEDQDLADGLTEAIAGKLAQISGLAVIGRTSVMQYRQTTKSVTQIGDELKVNHLLTSTLRRERGAADTGRLRIHAELVRTSDGTQVWSESYETEAGGVFSVQADLAERVANALEVTLLAPERQVLESQPTKSAAAYDAYLRGHATYTRSDDMKEILGAITLFAEAERLDPGFAQASAWLTICHALMSWYGYDATQARIDSARAALDRAAGAGPDLPETRLARAYFRYWVHLDYDGALAELTPVLRARPNDPAIVSAAAYVNRRRGNWDEALRLLEHAVELDPRSREMLYNLGQTYQMLRRFPEASRALGQARALTPTDGLTTMALIQLRTGESGADAGREVWRTAIAGRDLVDAVRDILPWEPFWLAQFDSTFQDGIERLGLWPELGLPASYHLLKGTARAALGRRDAARASFDSALVAAERQPQTGTPLDAGRIMHLARAYAGLGRGTDAVREAELAATTLPPSIESIGGANNLIGLATIYLGAGQGDKAVETLRRLLTIPSNISIPLLRNDPTWDPLRSNAGFQRLLQDGK